MTSIEGCPFFCSWSGGKDSSLALHHAIVSGGIPKALLTMMTEEGQRSRSHGLPVALIQRQAMALGIPLILRKASWNDYERTFSHALGELKADGIDCGVFGDIDLAPNREWVERVCLAASIRAYEPLWQRARHDLLDELLQLGFEATIIAVKQSVLDSSFLGRTLDRRVIGELADAGIDPSGEEGEYHTVVTNGPVFSCAIEIESRDQVVRDGYCFLDVWAMDPPRG